MVFGCEDRELSDSYLQGLDSARVADLVGRRVECSAASDVKITERCKHVRQVGVASDTL